MLKPHGWMLQYLNYVESLYEINVEYFFSIFLHTDISVLFNIQNTFISVLFFVFNILYLLSSLNQKLSVKIFKIRTPSGKESYYIE